MASFEQALGLFRGEAFAGLDTPWINGQRESLERARFLAELDYTDARLRSGRHGGLLGEVLVRAAAHPLDERAAGQAMLVLYQNGRQAEALEEFQRLRGRLADGLGLDPGPALQRLHRDILTQSPDLTPPDLTPPVSTPPAGTQPDPAKPDRGRSPDPARPSVPDLVPEVAGQAASEVFVGRAAALDRLAYRLELARRGRGQTVLVTGEPGIGKTSLLRQFARQAGGLVVWGACPEHVAAPPLWPWEQVLRAIRAVAPHQAVPERVAGLLDRDEANPDGADLGGDALRRFEAIGYYLSAVAQQHPLTVVIDDLHWTDRSSLQLLAYLAEFIPTSSVLLVATVRPQEATAVLADTVATLHRRTAERIELVGLDGPETLELVRAIAGDTAISTHDLTALRTRTAGNPFFLREVIRRLDTEPDLDPSDMTRVPPSVRDFVLCRLNRLPEPTATLLSTAAIAGDEFDLAVVAEAASLEVETALETIEPAIDAGLVVEDDRRLGWFGFTHALVAEALYEATGRWRRTRLHHRIGEISAAAWAGNPERAAEVARHWLVAADLGPHIAARAAGYAAAAAQVADSRLAPEAAAESWKQSLAAADLAGDGVDRYPMLVGYANSLYRSGNPRQGTPVFVEAMEMALDDVEHRGEEIFGLVSVAVAALCESNWYPVIGGAEDARLIDVLERARPRLTDPPQEALLLALLAAAHYYDDDTRLRYAMSDRAVALVRSTGDNATLAQVLYMRALALFVPDYSYECLAAVTEVLSLSELPLGMVAAARVLHSWGLATVGRTWELAAQLGQVALVGEQAVSPTVRVHLAWARASLELLAGRWAEADAISRDAYSRHAEMSFGVELGIALRIRMLQRWEAAFLTGRSAELIEELRRAASTLATPGLFTMLAVALTEVGRRVEAREVLRSVALGSQDYRWLYTKCWCLLAATRLGDTELIAELRGQLLPYRRMACAVAVHVVSGSVAYFTAEGALALGDPDAALADLEIALVADETMGAAPWLARARDAENRARRLKASGRLVAE
jgi:hypothetical protein